jgi:asparagine N-glycosylation enzyme membrane subunit Stt3
METENEAPQVGHQPPGLASPIAVTAMLTTLFLALSQIEGRSIDNDYLSSSLTLPLAALASACIGRMSPWLRLSSTVGLRVSALSIGLLAIAFAANSFAPSMFDNLFISTFFLVGSVTGYLVESRRFEESNIFLSTIVGLHFATSYAAGLGIIDGASSAQFVDFEREAIGSAFFAFWFASTALGITVTIALRGTLEDVGTGSMMSAIPTPSQNRETLIYAALIFIVQLIPLVWLGQIEDIEAFSESSHLGVLWAIFTTVVILLHAFFRAEGWHVLGVLLAVNWMLYTIGHLHEIGNELPYPLDEGGLIGSSSWFFVGFWLNFFGIMAASRGVFGDIAPQREPSGFRIWWKSNSYGILVGLALVTALTVRTAWNVIPAMNASGTGLWDMTGGSDPWYMKRVVDYVIAERSHLIFDHDRAYPLGGINPRPPLFSWSLALGGLGLSWLLEIPAEQAVWWSISALPAIYGALIVIPIAGIATRVHSRTAGIISAWLIALMPGHISRSTFAMADHDSFAMLFLATAFYFWIRALSGLEHKRLFESTSPNPLYLLAGMRESWKQNPAVMANATMSGIAFTIMALGWKGFVYGPGILFLAYSVQVAINIFRGRDSLQFTSAALQMMMTAILLPLPFYGWPGLNLVFAPSGMQPMFYIIGFTFAMGWVASSFRDKPWLLVIISGTVLFGTILGVLYLLQVADIYDGWDILFTGGFYFTKNKIFGTIGEAQAPSRGVLFASYGPVVALIAIGCGFFLLWRGSRQNKSGLTLLGLWVIIATYMAWTAGRFIINATPAMAVVGGIGIAMLWGSANSSEFVKEWRRSGIGTPRARFRSIWPATKSRPGVPVILIVLLLVTSQHTTYGIDSGIPRGEESAYDVDLAIYDIAPDILREDFFNIFSVMNSKEYNPDASGLWYMGTFGPSFNSQGWNHAYNWLSEQDSEQGFSERPAFVSWWDYGFQALASGQHPTVADNFQSGIPNSGGMLLSAGQEDTLAMFIATLAQGDRKFNSQQLGEDFLASLNAHMTPEQVKEFGDILSNSNREFVLNRSMAIVAVYNDVELLHGEQLGSDGLPQLGKVWVVLENGVQVGDPTSNQSEAMSLFNETRSSSSQVDTGEPAHYDIGGYRYTTDLIDDYYDISTGLHRNNAKLGLLRAFLVTAFDMDALVGIYHGITSIEYEVSDYDSPLGNTVVRNNEIRYFAVDNRLFPLGGSYYDDYEYHRGQTTGIFHAPTRLSGLDMESYISTIYQTQRGDGPIIPRTQAQYEAEYLDDLVRQTSGASSDPSEVIRMVDIDYQHQSEFFETMVARIYVGYGSSTLGIPGDAETPSVWFNPQQTKITGSPGSYLENAFALPGAMMNHFVISNWYDSSECELNETGVKISQLCGTIYDSNRIVKVLKYYSGATVEGTVELEGIGPVPNARILIERDAFSGEEEPDENGSVVDGDGRTFWIPIGHTQANENGEYSFTVPAGKIRVSAFSGEPDLESARSSIMASDVSNSMYELFTEHNEQRTVNPITGILGNVSGSTWLSEAIVNVSGSDGHSNGQSRIEASITVQPSTATGVLTWSGGLDFDGDSVIGSQVVLTPSSDEVTIGPYVAMTSNGTVVGQSLEFSGIGQVIFTGEGIAATEGVVTVNDFTGTHTQSIFNNHSITGEGLFAGKGTLSGELLDSTEALACPDNELPQGTVVCVLDDGDYLLNGTVNASGRFTADGSSLFSRTLDQATFVGSGTFETDSTQPLTSYGTINGTGMFSGTGIFSGPMVQPGSFHFVDALPGEYDVSIEFGDGTIVELESNFLIGLNAIQAPVQLSVSGGAIKGNLVDQSGESLDGPISIFPYNDTAENATMECSQTVAPPCMVVPDDNGAFQIGPIIPGTYIAEVDIDDDGFPEVTKTYSFPPEEDVVATFPSPVPDTSDLFFTLFDGDSPVSDLEISLRSENESMAPISAIYDSVANSYRVELSQGIWILNHTLDNDKQLWQRIEVGPDDLSDSFSFQVSHTVNGTVYYSHGDKKETGILEQVVGNEEIVFQWEGFTLSTTSDGEGNFSVTLPVDAMVDATVEVLMGVDGFFSNGTRFTVAQDMGDVSLTVVPGAMTSGFVGLNRPGNTYTDAFKDWEPVYVVAYNFDGTTDGVWRDTVGPDGHFDLILPLGNWTFVLDAGEMGSSTEIEELNSSAIVELELLVYPENNSTVLIDLFVDHDRDNNVSNGTAVRFPFTVQSLEANGTGYEVTADGDEWVSTGRAEISLEPGRYRIVVERADASADEPFDTLYDFNEVFQVGMDPSTIERSVGFEPLWLVNITFRNESDSLLVAQEVVFVDTESGWIQTFLTDEEGRVVEYLPESDWIVIVHEFETSPGVFEGLRHLISASQVTAGTRAYLRTSELAEVSIVLSEDYSGDSLNQMELKFTSQDGLGSFTAESSGFLEIIEIRPTPGMWNVELNQTDNEGVRWVIENTSLIESGVTVGIDHTVDLTVQRLVEMSGKVYWDLNDDEMPGFGEGLANVSVDIAPNLMNLSSGEGVNHSLTTDVNGDWAIYLPAGSAWNVTVERLGFATESASVILGASAQVENIEITAGSVEVSGAVSYISDEWIFDDDWIIVLIPAHGIARDRVVPDKVGNEVDGWTGEWTASVEPGRWIVYVSVDSSEEGLYLVAVDMLDADVEGGTVDSELSIGGKLFLDTEWLDYDGAPLSLSEIDDYDLVISIGMGMSWSEQLGEDGTLEMLLPTGRIDASSDFEVEQRGRNMSYSGGQGVTIRAGQDSPFKTLNLELVPNQDLGVSTVGESTVNLELDPGCEAEVDCDYSPAEFTLRIDYSGHNPLDTYDIVGTVPGTDGNLWLVEFENGSGGWNSTVSFEMGLDTAEVIDNFRVRVTPANRSQAHHFEIGHTILVKFSTAGGYSTDHSLAVTVPKFSGFDLTGDFADTVYFSPDEKHLEVQIPFQNLGNSDEFLSFDYQSPENWDAGGPQGQPISPFSEGITTLALSYTGVEEEQLLEYTIDFTVSDTDNNSYTYQISLLRDSPALSIHGSTIQLQGGGNPAVGQKSTYVVEVVNEAHVLAEDVTLRATLCVDIKCKSTAGVNSTAVSDIPAQGSSAFYIPMDFSNFTTPNKYYILFEIIPLGFNDEDDLVACGTEEAEGGSVCVTEAQLWSEAEEGVLGWITYLLLLMLALALWSLTRRTGRRPRAPF